ncbi:GNAT family N-acetyltransferase [Tissierella sp. MSJ-40]|uniref:GNAT family N-acetyltransferase n=1 Tax=Tissierella simiarum TaxID=2841534 RepID=A0ABS6E3C1_9FIRM|nr:GNAT family N-acetyltransferase [Tissierella simiarum]MBU5437277.1 GNAT family N-acetyltransferase [Tissierella simiarum]
MELQSNRILLKPITKEDLEFLYKVESHPLVYKYESSDVPSKEDVFKDYQEAIEFMSEKPKESLACVIYLAESGIPIGEVDIHLNWEEIREWEIGYIMHPDYWGKGYATEAVKLLIDYAFEKLNAHKIVAFCNAKNINSFALMKRIGMKKECHAREARLLNNQWYDEFMYSILDWEWSYLKDR